MDDLAQQIADLVSAGDRIAAIELLREATGMGLAEAKHAVEAAERGNGAALAAVRRGEPRPAQTMGLPEDVRRAAQAGDRIRAIRLLREQRGLGLKEAKDEIDRAFPVAATARRGCLLPLVFGLLAGAAWVARGG
ncbi:MAG TPA: hypothetical protein VFZ65_03220 [Planctomycetota bacterium]|nr:hypothetical protein [Planctomycetota bacterium]